MYHHKITYVSTDFRAKNSLSGNSPLFRLKTKLSTLKYIWQYYQQLTSHPLLCYRDFLNKFTMQQDCYYNQMHAKTLHVELIERNS